MKSSNIKLVVNTARGLENILGPKYARKLETRQTECPDVRIEDCLMDDNMTQQLEPVKMQQVSEMIYQHITAGHSVLVHCAQGKSRSTTVLAAFLCSHLRDSVDNILAFIKSKRSMAEPNANFVDQLHALEKSGALVFHPTTEGSL